MNDDSHHPQQAVRAYHDGQMTYMVGNLARKVPLVIGAILVLLVVNITLQYAAGPALNHALPLQDARGTVHIDGDAHIAQHGPDHDLTHDVAPGGADAELLCVDKELGCAQQSCSKQSVRYQACKSSCDACDQLKALIQADTGLQVRVVQQLTPCVDLHPTCEAWVKEDKCSRESKSMLELCQASCGFCLPPSASLLTASKTSTDSSSSKSSSKTSSSGVGSTADGPAVLLDQCQDDMNVCPYLAFTGMCSSGSMWITTQCARSCRICQPNQQAQLLLGDDAAVDKQQLDLNQQLIDSSSTTDSSSNAATPGPTTPTSSQPQRPVDSPAAAALLQQPVFGTPKISDHKLYGSHDPAGSCSSQALQEWQIKDCRDYVDRCSAWAKDGECSKNVDYMMISCKQSCNNCKVYNTNKPFRVVQLNSGYKMPTVGFGTAGLTVGTAAAVQFAVAAGYRMFDSAESPDWYDEAQVGAGLAAAKVPRDEYFLMSKIHPRDFGHTATLAAAKRSLGHYNTAYLNMLLLHYPSCTPNTHCVPSPGKMWQESWRTLEELVGVGLVRSIGVSNFGVPEMQELLKFAKIKPSVLQSRSDPYAVNHHLINFCIEHNITFIGYSTLGTQWINSPAAVNPVHNSELLKEIAKAHPGKSVGQVVLRWALQKGQVVIPRSASTTHIPENLQLFDFELSDIEMQAIGTLDGTWKTGGLPLPVA